MNEADRERFRRMTCEEMCSRLAVGRQSGRGACLSVRVPGARLDAAARDPSRTVERPNPTVVTDNHGKRLRVGE